MARPACGGPTVAVGTTIAGPPPHRSVQARLRIRLLPWMTGGEASVRIGMQNAGLWNPPVEDWAETSPSHLCALTATDQNAPPQPANATLKDAQLNRVPRNCMVLVVTQHHLAKPCTDHGRTMMLSALKLGLDGFELRDHSLLALRCRGAPASCLAVHPRSLDTRGYSRQSNFANFSTGNRSG